MICKNCGAELVENAKFCGVCGKEILDEIKKVKCNNCGNEYNSELGMCPNCGETEYLKIETNHFSNGAVNQGQSEPLPLPIPQPTETKKSLKKWQTALIAIAGILVVIIISVTNTLRDYNEKQKIDDEFDAAFGDLGDDLEDFDDDTDEIAYTKGTFENNIYTNEWANIKLTVPEGYIEGNSANYDSFSDGGITECGLYLMSPQYEMYAITFVDISSQKYVDENIFLSQLSAGISQTDIENVKYTIPEKFEDITIAGENYIVAHYKATTFGVDMVQSYYVRKIGDRLCNIVIINSTKEENDALVSNIIPVNE